ncbi:MAG: hypothetical protein ACJA1U_000769 [Bermanella sp.]|jgi:hypothetical protein
MLRVYFVLCLVVLFSASAHARQSCDWPFRTSVNIKENSGSNLSDYQVKLNINSSSFDSRYNWSSGGVDLRIFDSNDTSPLEFWIENWNQAAKTATVWVRFPASAPLIANANRNIFLYYGNTAATALANVPFTFVEPGIKFHTRNVTSNPNSFANAQTLFENSNDNNGNYGCTFITDFTGITNGALFGAKNNFIAYSETYFEVAPGEAGIWEFRYGADFGWGGGLYVNNTSLEEQWSDDLWWANNWNNPAEILQGSISLPTGYHKLEVIGGEPGNDGGITVQFRKPGGNWTTFSTSNIDIRSRACPVIVPTVTFGAHDVCGLDLALLSTTPSSNNWVVGSTQTLSFNVKNNDAQTDPAQPNTQISIILPSAFTFDGFSGNNWSCSGTSTLTCNYSQVLSGSQDLTSTLNITVTADNATPGSSTTITANTSGTAFDTDLTNNSQTFSINFLTNSSPASCTNPQQGLLVSFFDTQGYSPTTITNAAEYEALVNNRGTMPYLMGQTIVSNINGSGNPFDPDLDGNGNPDYFLGVFTGYIYLDSSDQIRFAVDGDDAIEARVNGSIVSDFYGAHGPQGQPVDSSARFTLGPGFIPIEFRIQEIAGGDVYTFYWSFGNRFQHVIIPNSAFYHCAGNADIQLNSTIQVISDPINSSNFKAIPGAVIQHTVNANNIGNISTDINSTVLVQAIDAQSTMYVGDLSAGSPVIFNDGAGNQASGLSYTFNGLTNNTDSLAFSTDGTNFNYAPVADTDGYDANITHFRLTLGGTFKPTFNGNTPTFNFVYQVKVD